MFTPHTKLELAVGAFVILGIIALGYLSISVGGVHLFPSARYEVTARFSGIGDLKKNAPVKIAGVRVGDVVGVELDDYAALVHLSIDRGIELPEDTIASIKTSGLLGESYVGLSPGASEQNLPDGGRIAQTEPALDLIQLLSKYAFGSGGSSADPLEAP